MIFLRRAAPFPDFFVIEAELLGETGKQVLFLSSIRKVVVNFRILDRCLSVLQNRHTLLING